MADGRAGADPAAYFTPDYDATVSNDTKYEGYSISNISNFSRQLSICQSISSRLKLQKVIIDIASVSNN